MGGMALVSMICAPGDVSDSSLPNKTKQHKADDGQILECTDNLVQSASKMVHLLHNIGKWVVIAAVQNPFFVYGK